MPKSASLLFPFSEDFQNKSLTRTYTPNDAIRSSITSFLLTEKGQRRGNSIGSFLPSLVHKLVPSTALAGLSEELKKELQQQFAGVMFQDIVLSQTFKDNVSTLEVSITFSTAITNIESFSLIV